MKDAEHTSKRLKDDFKNLKADGGSMKIEDVMDEIKTKASAQNLKKSLKMIFKIENPNVKIVVDALSSKTKVAGTHVHKLYSLTKSKIP